MKNKKIDDKIVNLFVSDLKHKFGSQIKKIILFGSRARGDHSKYSDYDFLIVCERISDKIRDHVDNLESQILLNNFALISTTILSEKQFEERIFEPYLINARKEGVMV